MCRLPPSALKPAATAIASISVDLPLPFSPASSVTWGSRSRSASCRIAGIENGYTVKSSISSRFRTTERTRASSTLRVYFRFGRVNHPNDDGGAGPASARDHLSALPHEAAAVPPSVTVTSLARSRARHERRGERDAVKSEGQRHEGGSVGADDASRDLR